MRSADSVRPCFPDIGGNARHAFGPLLAPDDDDTPLRLGYADALRRHPVRDASDDNAGDEPGGPYAKQLLYALHLTESLVQRLEAVGRGPSPLAFHALALPYALCPVHIAEAASLDGDDDGPIRARWLRAAVGAMEYIRHVQHRYAVEIDDVMTRDAPRASVDRPASDGAGPLRVMEPNEADDDASLAGMVERHRRFARRFDVGGPEADPAHLERPGLGAGAWWERFVVTGVFARAARGAAMMETYLAWRRERGCPPPDPTPFAHLWRDVRGALAWVARAEYGRMAGRDPRGVAARRDFDRAQRRLDRFATDCLKATARLAATDRPFSGADDAWMASHVRRVAEEHDAMDDGGEGDGSRHFEGYAESLRLLFGGLGMVDTGPRPWSALAAAFVAAAEGAAP